MTVSHRCYRVLMIAPTSFFLDYGSHVRILEEARILQSFGHTVKIVTYPLGRDISGLDIERAMPVPFRSRHEVGPSRSKLLLDVLLAAKSLGVALAFKPDIIHAHIHEGALIGGALSRLVRIPLVFDFQGSLTSEMLDHRFISPRSPVVPIARAVEKFIDHLPNIILPSSANAATLLEEEFRVPRSRIRVLADCVNPESFGPVQDAARALETRALQEKLQIPHEDKIVVYIGLLDQYRGTDVMLQAAQQLLTRVPHITWVIIGFPNIEHYQARARALGIADRVRFVGRVPYEDVPLWLSLGDVAVEPKMSATEAAGKVLNYMAMGLPVVAFDIPVMREYLADLGAYAPLGDATAFADQVESLLNEPERARMLGCALRERAQHVHSWVAAGRAIECAYEQILKK